VFLQIHNGTTKAIDSVATNDSVTPTTKAIVNEDEATVHRIQDNLKATKSHQQSYANKRRRPLQFEILNFQKCNGIR
jgi:hypothetical protein